MFKPIIKNIKPFPAQEGYTIEFVVTSGNQVVGNELTITNITTGRQVYKQKIKNLRLEHYIPANTLQNGQNYLASIRTFDVSDKASPASNDVMFWCFSEPIIKVTNIDDEGRVYNQTVEFSATYKQDEKEQLESFRFNLYNQNKALLKNYSEQFSDGSELLTQEVAGLDNGVLYYIEVKTLSVNGNVGTSGLIPFTPLYIAPKISVTLDPVNSPNDGAIKLRATIIQIILDLYDDKGNIVPHDDVEYVDGAKIDLNRGDYSHLYVEEGINIKSNNFMLQLWIESIPNNKSFFQALTGSGFIKLYRKDNFIIAHNELYNYIYPTRYISNEFDPNIQNCVTLRYDNGRISVDVQKNLVGVKS